jgi:hypothetical protein
MPPPTRGTAPPPIPWTVKPTNAESTINTAHSRSGTNPYTGPPSAAQTTPYPSNTLTNPYPANVPPSATSTDPYPVTGTWPEDDDPHADSSDPWSATSANTERSSNGAIRRGLYAGNPSFAPQRQRQHQDQRQHRPRGRLTIQYDPRLAHIFEPMPPMTTTPNTPRGAGVNWRAIDWNPPRSNGTPAANTAPNTTPNTNRRGSESVLSTFTQQFPHDFPPAASYQAHPPPSPYPSPHQQNQAQGPPAHTPVTLTDPAEAENPTSPWSVPHEPGRSRQRSRRESGRQEDTGIDTAQGQRSGSRLSAAAGQFVPESAVQWEGKNDWECGWCGGECLCKDYPD